MLIFIIFVSILVLAIIYIVFSIYDKIPPKIDDTLAPIAFVCLILFTFASVITGVMGFATNSSETCAKVRKECAQTEMVLKMRYEALTKLNDDYLKYVLVTEYNNDVSEYKSKLIEAQNNLANPWVNWFTCHEYNNFNAEEIYYYEIYNS